MQKSPLTITARIQKDMGECIPAPICPLSPPSSGPLSLSSLLSQSSLNETLWLKTKHRFSFVENLMKTFSFSHSLKKEEIGIDTQRPAADN